MDLPAGELEPKGIIRILRNIEGVAFGSLILPNETKKAPRITSRRDVGTPESSYPSGHGRREP